MMDKLAKFEIRDAILIMRSLWNQRNMMANAPNNVSHLALFRKIDGLLWRLEKKMLLLLGPKKGESEES